MKFIPLENFEAINSLLQGVEAQGCLLTIRLEAYTCRHTRTERDIATNLAHYVNVTSTPPLSSSPVIACSSGMAGGMLPPPLVLGGTTAPGEAAMPVSPVKAEQIDDRLVFLVAALNLLYGGDGYDFSVLRETDFIVHTEQTIREELNLVFQALPEQCRPAVRRFWPAITEQVMDASRECEYFEFACPSCDPLTESKLFSKHYFLYNRRKKSMVSIVEYGEGNLYRGDDGYPVAMANAAGSPDDEMGVNYCYVSSPKGDADFEYSGKNRDFYGY